MKALNKSAIHLKVRTVNKVLFFKIQNDFKFLYFFKNLLNHIQSDIDHNCIWGNFAFFKKSVNWKNEILITSIIC